MSAVAHPTLPAGTLASLLPRWRVVWLPISIAVAAVLIRLSVGPLTYDDAYITFRYARNLATGLGLVYNSGEQVLGTTTPLWTLILAGSYRLGLHDLPAVALVLSSLADGVTVYCLFVATRRFGWEWRWSAWIALLFALCPLSIGFAASGMEMSLFLALVLAALLTYEQPDATALLTGLAVLCRPEGIIVAALILGSRTIHSRRLPLTSMAIIAAVVLPWAVFSTVSYGSPIPESVLVKASHYSPGAAENLIWLIRVLGTPGFNESMLEAPNAPLALAFIVGLVLLVAMLVSLPRLARYLRRSPEMIPLALFAPMFATILVAEGLRSAHIFPWYLVPLVPFALIAVVALTRHATCRRPVLAVLAVAIVSLWTLAGLSLDRGAGSSPFVPLDSNLSREQAYRQAAEHLAPQLSEQATIAAPEIGALGYFSNSRILDTAGLVSPAASRFYPLPQGYQHDITVPPDLILETMPDAIVVFDRFLPTQLIEAAWFKESYVLSATFEARIWGNSTVFVYVQR